MPRAREDAAGRVKRRSDVELAYAREIALPEIVSAQGSIRDTVLLSDDVADAIAIGIAPPLDGDDEGELRAVAGTLDAALRYGIDIAELAARARFTGKAGAVHIVELPKVHGQRDSVLPWQGLPLRVVLLGWGDGSASALRQAGAALAGATRGLDRIVAASPATTAGARAFAEGYLLGSYRIPTGEHRLDPAQQLVLLAAGPQAERIERAIADAGIVAESTWLARDLVNAPASVATPQWIAARAVAVAQAHGLFAQVWDEDQLAAEGFGGLLAVGQGSVHPPRLVVVDYLPTEDSVTTADSRHIALIGKGITFDSGGLSLKPRPSMPDMKDDMTGAAVVLGAVVAAARRRSGHRVTAVLALAENLPGAAAYRPGDVATTWNGTTVEVVNTDAEGRMVLADAIAYTAERLAPDLMIDVATLTGAAVVALGQHDAGIFTADEAILAAVRGAAVDTGERVWQLPLVPEYEPQLNSVIADVRQASAVPAAPGAIIAALFLQRFTGGARWAHLDIAGEAMAAKNDGATVAGGTGFGVRLLAEFIASS